MEASKGVHTTSELISIFKARPAVIAHWKRQLQEGAPCIFSRGMMVGEKTEMELTAPLYEEIGRLKMEVDFLKNALLTSLEEKRGWSEPGYAQMPRSAEKP